MIKHLSRYLIPEIFDLEIKSEEPWNNINITGIIEDFYNLTKKLKIYDKIFLDGDGSWQDDDELLDLQLSLEQEYNDSLGSFYITWYKEDWKCKNIWYSADKDGEQIYDSWENL